MEVEGFIFRNNDDDDNEWEQHSWRRSSDPLAANTPWLPLLMMPDYHHLRAHVANPSMKSLGTGVGWGIFENKTIGNRGIAVNF